MPNDRSEFREITGFLSSSNRYEDVSLAGIFGDRGHFLFARTILEHNEATTRESSQRAGSRAARGEINLLRSSSGRWLGLPSIVITFGCRVAQQQTTHRIEK